MFLLCVFLLYCFTNKEIAATDEQKVSGCFFCRPKNVGVALHPYMSLQDSFNSDLQSASDIISFLPVAGEEFQIVVVDPFDSELSRYLTLLVANQNDISRITLMNKTMEVLLKLPLQRNLPFEYVTETLVEVFESANQLYNGTSSTIIIEFSTKQFPLRLLQTLVLELGTKFPYPHFKIAVEFDVQEFQAAIASNKTLTANEISKNFELVDLILFSDFKQESHYISISTILQQRFVLYQQITDFVRLNAKHNLTFGFILTWPDTSYEGVINYSRQVEFWKGAIQFAKRQNYLVIFESAFDTPYGVLPNQMSTGWWRIEKTVTNDRHLNSSEVVYKTKQSLAELESSKSNHSIIAGLKREPDFFNEYFSVTLNPYVSSYFKDNPQFLQASLLPLLVERVADRFSSIFLATYNMELGFFKDSIKNSEIPQIIANHNLNTINKPLNLTMAIFKIDNADQVDAIVELVHESNYICPGTVTELILYPFSTDILHEMVYKITYRLNMNSSNVEKTPVRLGTMWPIEVCTRLNERLGNGTIFELMNSTNQVYFSYVVGDRIHKGYHFGIDRVLNQVFGVFENCVSRFKKALPNITVGFETGFPSSMGSVTEEYASLATFWLEINAWAKRTKTRIVMSGAFDSPSKANGENIQFGHYGWWRTVDNDGSKTIEFDFEEKRKVALMRLIPKIPEAEANHINLIFILYVPIALGIVLLITCLAGFIIFNWKSKNHPGSTNMDLLSEISPNEQTPLTVLPDNAFVKEACEVLGSGQFGKIYKCYMTQFQTTVAVKIANLDVLQNRDQKLAAQSLISEMKIMAMVGEHENILQLLGVGLGDEPFIVVMYCKYGSLLNHLRRKVEDKPEKYELLHYCAQIASGMHFLSEKQVIHTDLSARNVLLDEHNICKISDFGLSRKLKLYENYMKKGEEPLPWRWMAAESLARLEFSTKSDVWSMGVTFWEVYTLGKIPYLEISFDIEGFRERLENGLRLSQPEEANEEIWTIISKCWSHEPGDRPTAKNVCLDLRKMKILEYEII